LKLIYRQSSPRTLLIGLVLLAPLLLLLSALQFGMIEAFIVTSASMEPVLKPLDRVLVDRRSGFVPRHSDLVTFPHPSDPAGPRLVKRVIGLGGDRIAVRDGRVFRDDQPLEEPYLPEDARTLHRPNFAVTVPPGHVFVAGDNRNSSVDSFDFGPVPLDEIDGRPLLIFWPRGRMGRIHRPPP
jgi:signal peptidase I